MRLQSLEFAELTRRATDLLSDTADVPRLLKIRLGKDDPLAVSGDQMLASIEALVRELRSFDASGLDDGTGPAENEGFLQRR